MRELRSSTVSAREKKPETEAEKKPTTSTRSKKAGPSAKANVEKAATKTEKNWKTRGRIRTTTVKPSSADTSKEEEEEEEEEDKEKEGQQEEQDEEVIVENPPKEETNQDAVAAKDKSEAPEEKESSANKENKSVTDADDNVTAKPQMAEAVPKSPKRAVVDVALEEEAEEDSANDGKASPDSAPAKTSNATTKPKNAKKRRIVYDEESVTKAVNDVIEGKMGAKKAAEKFGVSRSVVERRVRSLRGPSSTSYAKKRVPESDVHVIRVEDLD